VGVFRALNGRFSHGAEKFEYFFGIFNGNVGSNMAPS